MQAIKFNDKMVSIDEYLGCRQIIGVVRDRVQATIHMWSVHISASTIYKIENQHSKWKNGIYRKQTCLKSAENYQNIQWAYRCEYKSQMPETRTNPLLYPQYFQFVISPQLSYIDQFLKNN
ncbi:Hypothetical_protein [Hexamita inflata]|uniref:Hypothetical_protein n=1 Tax=Hexamita inflata TaxID=28002 RepID=A0AA86RA70_9EUKA|nr:Hypothetical protein HINF_LOCUS57881 [Hexamita inflata]